MSVSQLLLMSRIRFAARMEQLMYLHLRRGQRQKWYFNSTNGPGNLQKFLLSISAMIALKLKVLGLLAVWAIPSCNI